MNRELRRQYERRRRILNAELDRNWRSGKPISFTIHAMPLLEAAGWPGFGQGILDYVRCIDTARPDARTSGCFVCDEPWTPDRVPVSMALIEFIQGASGRKGAVCGICQHCADYGAGIVAAAQHRFPNCDMTLMPQPQTRQ